MRKFTNEVDMVQRQLSVQQIKRWEEFKTKRQDIANQYIAVKKQIWLVSLWIKTIKMCFMVRQLFRNVETRRSQQVRLNKILYTYLRTCVLFKRMMRRHGPIYTTSKHLNRIRYSFTYSVCSGKAEIEAKKALKAFAEGIVWFVMAEKMKSQTRHFNTLVNSMQSRMKQKCQTTDAKVEVMLNAWNSKLWLWFKMAIDSRDSGMK